MKKIHILMKVIRLTRKSCFLDWTPGLIKNTHPKVRHGVQINSLYRKKSKTITDSNRYRDIPEVFRYARILASLC